MSAATTAQVVTFRLAGDLFAADIFTIERVLRYVRPTAVPTLPSWIDGVVEHEARVVPVVDLRTRFGLERREPLPETRIIVVAVEEEWIGVVVDAVLEVVTVSAEQVTAPPKLFRGLAADYVRGLVRREDALLIFLDVTKLLSTSERIALEAALRTAHNG